MPRNVPTSGVLAAIAVVFFGCAQPASDSTAGAIERLTTPAAPKSAEPNLTVAPDGGVYLSWIEDIDTTRVALRFDRVTADGWAGTRTIAGGSDWFVNWADFPSISIMNDGTMAAHWLAKSSAGTYSYDVRIGLSRDNGTEWSEPVTPHDDGTPTEHGFVTMLPWGESSVLAAWLDGRNTGGGHDGGHGGPMTLRAAMIDADGSIHHPAELDAKVCDCCQTGGAVTNDGAVIAYRDRSDAEVRDISVVRYDGTIWSDPQTLHADGWEIAGCPVNGPSVYATGSEVAVGWFTAAGGTPKVLLTRSGDDGRTFEQPVRIDDGQPLGRVSVLLDGSRNAYVVWLEAVGEEAEIRLRRLTAAGTKGEAITVTRTSGSRASGFPRVAMSGGILYFAWTEVAEQRRVRIARLDMAARWATH